MPDVEFTTSSANGSESGGVLTATLSLTSASAVDVEVPFTLSGNLADPDDYSLSVSSPVTILAGELSATLQLTPAGDLLDEDDETLTLDLGTPTGANLASQVQFTFTLLDDDDPPEVTFSSASQTGAEDVGSVTVDVNLSAVSGRQVTVPLVPSGTATASDFTLPVSTVVLDAGDTSATVTINVTEDVIDEDDETATFTMTGVTHATLGATPAHSVTITDNDLPPQVAFAIAGQGIAENGTTAPVSVALSGESGKEVSVNLLVGGTATNPDDYTLSTTSVVLPAGTLSVDVDLTAVDDVLDEEDETVILTLDGPTNAGLGAVGVHTATLLDADDPPTVEFFQASQSAGEGSGTVQLTVELSAISGQDVTVPYSLSGTAIDPDDYTITAGPLLIPAGQSSGDLTVTLASDLLDEDDETVVVTLDTPTGATFGTTLVHTLTIQDDDDPPTVSFAAPTANLDESSGANTLEVVLSDASGLEVSVDVSLSGDAIQPDDYDVDTVNVVFPAGVTSQDVTLTVVDDALYEGDETVSLTLNNPSEATLGATPNLTATLVDNDTAPEVDFQTTSVPANENGGTVNLTVQLSAVSGLDVSIPFSTAGTAVETDDYSIDASPLLISAGQTSADIQVNLADDILYEGVETIEIHLGAPTDGSLGTQTISTITLTSDDPEPVVQFNAAAQLAPEGAGSVTMDLVLSGPSGSDTHVPFVASGTAISSVDYSVDGAAIVVPAGQLTASRTVTLLPDALDEVDETAIFTLQTPTGAALGAEVVHTLTIGDDDDPPTVSVITPPQTVPEDAGVVWVGVQLSAESGRTVTVPFTLPGTATQGLDYNAPVAPLVIPPGSLTADLPITVLDDLIDEVAEERVRFVIDTAGLDNATPGADLSTRVMIQDNDGPGGVRVPASLRPDRTRLVFGLTEEGETSAVETIVITNTHNAPLTIASVDAQGDQAADYLITYGQTMPATLLPGETATFDVAFQPTECGLRTAKAVIIPAAQNLIGAAVVLRGRGVGIPGDEIRMNAGPDAFTDSSGDHWARDHWVTGDSGVVQSSDPIAGTVDDLLYQVARVGTQFGYGFPLPDGDYDVELYFSELEYSGASQRVFDVWLEGQEVISDLDLFVTAGDHVAWTPGPLRVTSTGGTLEIDFSADLGEAAISGVRVRSVPLLNSDVTNIDFQVVEQGNVASQPVNLTNPGLMPVTVTQVVIVPQGDAGTAADFIVEIGGTDYAGGTESASHTVSIPLDAANPILANIRFEPSEHEDLAARIDFVTSEGVLSVDIQGTGGADPGWGFLHPVISSSPTLIVDYDQDGSEPVDLRGDESHTHEPGQILAVHEWSTGGTPFSTQSETTVSVPIGSATYELTITDDKPLPDSASESIDLVVYQPDQVPGLLISYFDGQGDPIFLLDNPPTIPEFMERNSTGIVLDQGGFVGGSQFTGDVMVSWTGSFVAPSGTDYEFTAVGGVASRVIVDGQLVAGPVMLTSGVHDIDLRFAVDTLANLPLRLDVTVGGQLDQGWVDVVVHDETPIVPILNEMPTVGTELGGNTILLEGFGFFPKDQVVVDWGGLNIPSANFISWSGETIEFLSPPGTGSVNVRVQTPNGFSNTLPFQYSPDGPVPIAWDRRTDRDLWINDPTTGVWHPNGKLYVGTLSGQIIEITYDDDWNATTQTFSGISGLVNHDLCGIAINPFDASDPVKLYVAHGEHFVNGGGSFSGSSPFTGGVSVLTGPNFDTPVPLITGLPTSNHDHGVNGLEFDNNGDLLIGMGGNTNAGVPWPLAGDLPGSPLSGAVLKAHTSRPDFNGTIQYRSRIDGSPLIDQVDGLELELDGTAHIEVWAPGLRNAYDLVLTTEGQVYVTDNGPNVQYGPASTGPSTDSGVHPQHDDEINLLRPGAYFGHPNRNRGQDDARQDIWRDPADPASDQYTPPTHLTSSASCGIGEYRSESFNSQIRGWLIAQKWNDTQRLLELDADGAVVSELEVNPLMRGLDVIVAPGGALISMDYSYDQVRITEPDDVSVVGMTALDIHPWRTTSPGGTPFTIGGHGFLPGQTTVTVDGVPCTVTNVTSTRITGIYPALPENRIGQLYDVAVSSGPDIDSISQAVLALPATPGLAKGFWTTGADIPDALGEVASGVIGSKMYVIGEGTNKTYAYDLLSNTWDDTLATRPFPGNHHALEVWSDKLILIGGLGGSSEGKVQIYDPVLDSWTVGADMPWSGGSVNSALIDDKIYVCGGIVGSFTVNNLSMYDPALDDWDVGGTQTLTAMPTGVNHAASVTDGELLWIFGGRAGGNVPQPGFDVVQTYDPVTGVWDSSDLVQSNLTPMPQARGGTGKAVFFDGEFMVFGGEDASVAYAEVQVYRPVTHTWREDTDLPTARHGVFPAAYQGRIYLAGGGTVAGFSSSAILEIFQR